VHNCSLAGGVAHDIKGTGLGLCSVCSFVNQSGGFVTLAGEQGKGTTVNLYLPRALNDPVAKRSAGAKVMPQGDGELILVVEDDDRVREITLTVLESLGYAVAEARSGPEAIKLLKSGEPIDLVFSDVVMPGNMTGYDVAQWVATMKSNIKVVLTTGYDSKGDASPAGAISRFSTSHIPGRDWRKPCAARFSISPRRPSARRR
jgi:CheY-like chemotaxis protein